MTASKNTISGDGRLTVLLFLMSSLLLFDFTNGHGWPLVKNTDDYRLLEQLRVVHPNKLIVDNALDAGRGPGFKNVPTRYTPFFFDLIPINSADKDMLMTVKGVGPALADSIIEYRHHFGPFKESKDLLNLKGVGPKRAANFATVFTFAEVP